MTWVDVGTRARSDDFSDGEFGARIDQLGVLKGGGSRHGDAVFFLREEDSAESVCFIGGALP